MTTQEHIELCERYIEDCRKAQANELLPLWDRVGAACGEIDWMVARMIIEEENTSCHKLKNVAQSR